MSATGLIGWCRSLSILACLHVPLLAVAASVQTPPFERVQLDNGAVLLLMERHEVPLIFFSAKVRGGAQLDPPQLSGIASLTGDLLQKGAGGRDAFAFADAIAAVGGTLGTYSDLESITVHGSFLARDQALMVELLADMLQRPALRTAELEALRARQIEFIRAAKDSDIQSLLQTYGNAALFGTHPYGHSMFGSEASLASITQADVADYYQKQFGADRLIVAVAGDFKASQMKRLLTRAFAGWRKAGAAPGAVAAPAPASGRRVVLIDAPDSVQSYFWAGNVGVAMQDPRRAALTITNTIFGGRFTSMLNSELRIRTGLSYGASSSFDRLAQPGVWQLSSFTRTQTTIEAIDLALQTLDALHAKGFDATALDSGRSYVQGQFPLALETSGQWASQLAVLEMYGLDRRYIDNYGAQLDAVTLDAARAAIGSAFPGSDNLVLVVIGNAAAIRDGLKKYGPVTEMKLSDPTFEPRGSGHQPPTANR